MARMFGTDGIRGLANVPPLSPEIALALGRAAVRVLAQDASQGKPSFILGRDTRLSSPMLEAALTAGLCSAGADVLLAGVLPTPGIAYLTRHTSAVGGIVISASHNAYMDNGIKFFAGNGAKLDDKEEEAIEACAESREIGNTIVGEAVGTPHGYEHGLQYYTAFLKGTFRHHLPVRLRIGLDCANGAASVVAPALFRALGADVVVWQADPNGININHSCGAVAPEFLQHKILQEQLDVGFAFDGDADRLIAVDHQGRVLDGDYVLAICAQDLLEEQADACRVVVSTVMANLGLEQALERMGFALHRTPVGDKSVVEGMRQTGALLGGEQSGHVVFLQHHTTGDGLLTALQLLNVMLAKQQPLATLAATLQKFPQTVLNVKIRERRDPLKLPAVHRVIEQARQVLGKTGRIVVRLSGTEAVVRVMLEGPEQSLIEALAHDIAKVIRSELGSL